MSVPVSSYIDEMIDYRAILSLLVLAFALVSPASVAADKKYYRYINLDGNVVIDHRVPTDYAGHGYEVLNSKGVVLEVVPRRLSAEERAARASEIHQAEEAKAARQRAQERDSNLLLRYSSVEDIEAAKQRALRDLRIRISILKSNQTGLKHKMEVFQAQAADLERQGESVDIERLKAMEDLRQELVSTEQSIASRQGEVNRVASDFDSDIARFNELLDLVELRRRKERGEVP